MDALQDSIRAYYGDALTGFSTEEVVVRYRLLNRLRDSLARIDD